MVRRHTASSLFQSQMAMASFFVPLHRHMPWQPLLTFVALSWRGLSSRYVHYLTWRGGVKNKWGSVLHSLGRLASVCGKECRQSAVRSRL